MEQGKTRKDRILAVVRRVEAQEVEIQTEVKKKVREAMQKSRELEDRREVVNCDAASSPAHDR